MPPRKKSLLEECFEANRRWAKASLAEDPEFFARLEALQSPDLLWIGNRNSPNQIIVKDPSLMAGASSSFADLPGGHSEGYDDSHKQLFRRFYQRIADRKAKIDYPTLEDGLWGMTCLEAVGKSHKKQAWVKVG